MNFRSFCFMAFSTISQVLRQLSEETNKKKLKSRKCGISAAYLRLHNAKRILTRVVSMMLALMNFTTFSTDTCICMCSGARINLLYNEEQ